MARKKQLELNENQDKDSSGFVLDGDAKRSIVAIVLFAFAILAVLGFWGQAAILGQWIDIAMGLSFGWGKWLSAVVLVTMGIVLLFRKETAFYVLKIIGIAVSFWALLGFFHLYLSPDQFLSAAQQGQGGGYLGYVLALSLLKFTGVTAGTVVLVTLLLVGLTVALNMSIVHFFQRLRQRSEEGVVPMLSSKDKVVEETKEVPEESAAPKREFVKGPDEDAKDKAVEGGSLLGAFKRKSLKGGEDDFGSNAFISEVAGAWQLPSLDLLEASSGKAQGGDVEKNAEIIQKTLGHFGVEVELGGIQTGPTITQYTFRPAVGIKLSKITGLSDDLALALAAHPIRIEAPIPGKSLIGIEVPNKSIATVRLKDIFQSDLFRKRTSNLMLSLGKNVSGEPILGNLEKMPHLMIAGSTGTGKSVCVNAIITALLYQNSPDDLKFILVDPKRVELSLYNGIPHLLADVIVDNAKVLSALKWAIGEMERRYISLQETGSRDIRSYNQKVTEGHRNRKIDKETGEVTEEEIKKLPFIVIIIDELADLMSSHGKEVEGAIIRLAQMARAVGIHLIVSTQRPSVEVLTGLIKANITTRVAFKVATQIDSRTILDTGGAEKLLGNGDLLFVTGNSEGLKRLQGVFVSESEVKRVVKFVKGQKIERADEEIGENVVESSEPGEQEKLTFDAAPTGSDDEDPMYEEAKKVVIECKKASASLLQRRLRLGYARAARMLDILEDRGVIGPGDGAKPREVYIAPNDTEYADPMLDQSKRDKWQL
ncbi:DNA translocase FtsK [Patescibacteria group bacterium]|nr:MAG: DNA translocase FtsK [Patescibacteria group bacterium]